MSIGQAKRSTPAFTDIDFEKKGRQIGFVMFPHSPHDDAWGVTRVPIAVIANGAGPTVIIEGGNHGDEYEGPIVIGELARDLDLGRLQGQLILMPAVNTPAVTASRRTSPIDRLNFNRTFPGDPAGTLTQQISAYVADYILPMGDAFLDLHSGGSSLDFIPSAVIEPTDDEALGKRNAAAARAFDAPVTVVVPNLGDQRTATATACRTGLVTVGTELGGGGRVSSEALTICRRGVRNVLVASRRPRRRTAGGTPLRQNDLRVARNRGLRLCAVAGDSRDFPFPRREGQSRRARRANPPRLGARSCA